MTTATFIKNWYNGVADQSLYRLDDPVSYKDENDAEQSTEYVVVSAAIAMFTGPETYIFPADEDGKVLDWGELEGSYRGGLDKKSALEGAGWVVLEDAS